MNRDGINIEQHPICYKNTKGGAFLCQNVPRLHTAEKQPLSITEISEKLGLYKSNVYDILSTLCAMGYLDRSTESSKFYLGKKIVVLGRMASDRYSFKNIASPYLHQLANEVGEIAYLTVPIGIHHIIYISCPASVQNAEYVPSGALSRITILTLFKKGI